MDELWQIYPEAREIYLRIMKAESVERREDEKRRRKAQPPTGKPTLRRLDVTSLAALDEADDAVGTGQLGAFRAPTAKPACSIIL
jgi:hypothetical protein